MPFSIRPYRRFPVQCSVTYNAGPFQGQGTVWNFSCAGWRLTGDLPMRPGETLSLTVTLPNEQRIVALKRWCGSRGDRSWGGEYIDGAPGFSMGIDRALRSGSRSPS